MLVVWTELSRLALAQQRTAIQNLRTLADLLPSDFYPPYFTFGEGAVPKKKKSSASIVDDAFEAADLVADRTLESGEMVLRLLEEQFGVDRRRIETGRVLVRKTTKERVVEVTEDLERLEFEIERVPVDAFVETRPTVTETEHEIVIPVVEEVIVVERRLRLREEIRIKKSRHVEHFRDEVRLRVQEAEVRRLSPRPSTSGD